MDYVTKRKAIRRPHSKRQIQILYNLRRYHEIPIKFQYLGIGATRYDKLCKDPHYISNSELGLLRDKSPQLLQYVMNKIRTSRPEYINVIDIGCGNGEAGAYILSHFVKNTTGIRLRYVALDFSGKMRSIAEKTIDTLFNTDKNNRTIDFVSKSLDFDHDDILDRIFRFHQSKNNINIFLFLGNTLGNYCKFGEQIRILTNISKSMRPRDYLVLGVELTLEHLPNSLVKMYSNPLVISFLSTALELVHIEPQFGDHKGYGKIEATLARDKDVDIKFRFTQLCVIPGTTKGEDLRFRIGDTILLANSIRFHLEELKQVILPKAYLKSRGIEISDNTGSALLLCCLKK